MRIEFLADRSEFVPELARYHYEEWGPMRPGETLDDRIARLTGTCNRSGIPLAVVATDGARLCGSAILVESDMDSRPQWRPWLAGVFVVPEFRGRGIGTALVEDITARVRATGLDKYYLYTPSAADFYARMGWVEIERCVEKGVQVVVMLKSLAD
jgi:GNAT superfamily N-acetyltransferase